MKNKFKLGIIALAIVAATGVAGVSAFAQTANTEYKTFVQSLAQKLGISEDKVNTAVTEIHNERHQEMLQKYEEKLSTAVKNGEITEAQKTLILEKGKQLEEDREAHKESMKDKTPEERRTEMEQKRTELEAWAKENNIDMKYLRFGFGGRGHKGGMGMGMGMHMALPATQ
jgi:hypothetical protein